MMKRFLFFAILLLPTFALAQNSKKVAVYITGENSGVNKVLGDQLVAGFACSGKYIAVERTASFLAELGKEQSYQRTGTVSDNQIAALGVQFGVNYVCVADVSEVFGEKYISARLIDVETAEVVNTHNVAGEMNSMNKCLQMANEITGFLTKGTFAEQAEEARKAEQLKAQGLVDLGLPSGTLWKDKNEPGLYTYGEAIDNFGNQVPTKEQFEELMAMCNWTHVNEGYKVIGPNGNSIYLSAEGWRNRSANLSFEKGKGCYYWSSTISDSIIQDNGKIFNLSWVMNNKRWIKEFCVDRELSVRLVKNP